MGGGTTGNLHCSLIANMQFLGGLGSQTFSSPENKLRNQSVPRLFYLHNACLPLPLLIIHAQKDA